MTSLFFADLVREHSAGVGAGALALAGALPGHRRFADAVPPSARFHYTIAGVTHPAEWEVGEGAIDASGALLRAPHASSNGGAAVDLSPGLKTVALTVAAPWFAAKDVPPPTPPQPTPTATLQASDRIAGNAANGAPLSVAASALPWWDGSRHRANGTISVPGHLLLDTSPVDWSPAYRSVSLGYAGGTLNYRDFSVGVGLNYYHKDGADRGIVSGNAVKYEASGAGEHSFWAATSVLPGEPVSWQAQLDIPYAGTVRPGRDAQQSLGDGGRRWAQLYVASGAIATSDARDKRGISPLPDRWLDAWGAVAWRRFRMAGGTRWHGGLVAQQVRDVFAAHGLDATRIGLLCHDQWDEERVPVISKKTGKPMPRRTRRVRKAGDRWGLRYDECFALEAAWVRRELARLGREIPHRKRGGGSA